MNPVIQLMERAIHALRTGQPNLAKTYTRRAQELLAGSTVVPAAAL